MKPKSEPKVKEKVIDSNKSVSDNLDLRPTFISLG